MAEASTRPNCYKCRYRGEVSGDAHSQCTHPVTKELHGHGGLVLSSFFWAATVCDSRVREAGRKLSLQANIHGINNGWFNWPFNFDPVWLVACEGFKRGSVK